MNGRPVRFVEVDRQAGQKHPRERRQHREGRQRSRDGRLDASRGKSQADQAGGDQGEVLGHRDQAEQRKNAQQHIEHDEVAVESKGKAACEKQDRKQRQVAVGRLQKLGELDEGAGNGKGDEAGGQ